MSVSNEKRSPLRAEPENPEATRATTRDAVDAGFGTPAQILRLYLNNARNIPRGWYCSAWRDTIGAAYVGSLPRKLGTRPVGIRSPTFARSVAATAQPTTTTRYFKSLEDDLGP